MIPKEALGGLLPIREVARRTGVNPVTLRAWERRYGLIVPQRTAKGHRLYSQDQVERVLAILDWLARGVAVSQVGALLEQTPTTPPVAYDSWVGLRSDWLEAVAALAERRLEALFNGAAALYPPATLAEQLLLPTLAQLERSWQAQFGAQLERLFLYGWLRGKLGARVLHNNSVQTGTPLLFVSLDQQPQQPTFWLSTWLASCAGVPVTTLDGAIPVNELNAMLPRLSHRALVLCASRPLDNLLLRQLPRLLDSADKPVLLCGAAATLHRDELNHLTTLAFADEPLATFRWLRERGLLEPA